VFTFDGNNIFIPIDDKPKKTGNSNQLKRVKNIQKNTNCIASLLAVVCGVQIIQDLKHHYKQ
jgi:hypothetical protein